MADIQVNLVGKGRRAQQSHDIAKRVRPPLVEIAKRYDARIKVAEVPPGPPVLSTLVAEVYGPDYERQREIAGQIMKIFEADRRGGGCGLVSWRRTIPSYQLAIDREQAALHGISVMQIAGYSESGPGRPTGGTAAPAPGARRCAGDPAAAPGRARRYRSACRPSRCARPTATWCRCLPWCRSTKPSRRQEHLPQKSHAGGLCDRRCGRRQGKPGLRHSGNAARRSPPSRLPEGYEIEQHTASIPDSDRQVRHEVGRRMAHHL